MLLISRRAKRVLKSPTTFVLQVLKGFSSNQGMLLAGAVAYYALLSAVPLLILSVVGLSHFVEQAELLSTLGRYLEWLIPSQSSAVLSDVKDFLENSTAISAMLLLTMIFFSALAFGVLEKSMAIIFSHREKTDRRYPLIAAILPYGLVFLLGIVLLGVTAVSIALEMMSVGYVHLPTGAVSLRWLSGLLLYLLGFFVEVVIVAAIYMTIPVGRTCFRHALIGGVTAAILWEILRHILVWYFTTISKVSIVYGSLTTAVVVLFSMECIAILLLLGAQVISEYERLKSA